MGATTDLLLEKLDASTSRTTTALKALVQESGTQIEALETEVASLKTKFPTRVFGTIEQVTMGMNGMSDPALQLSVKSIESMQTGRRKTEFFISQKLAGPAALNFIKNNKIENTFDLIDRKVELLYDDEEERYDVTLINVLPFATARNGDSVFEGSRVEAKDGDGNKYIGTAFPSDEPANVNIKRDDGFTGGGPNGEYVAYKRSILAVL